MPRCCWRRTGSAWIAVTTTSPRSTSRTRSSNLSRAPGIRCRTTAHPRTRTCRHDPPRWMRPMSEDLPLTGGCNCGAVRFEVTAPLVAASYCHCKRCQRRTGTAASANAHPAEGAFRIVSGEDRLRIWKPEGGGEKWFCGDCGSSVFGRNLSHADPIGIRMGTFDGDPGIRPSVRQFVDYAAPWEAIPDDGLPRYPESRHAD